MDADLAAMYDMTEEERKKMTSKRYPRLPELAVLAAAVPWRGRPTLDGATAAPAASDTD